MKTTKALLFSFVLAALPLTSHAQGAPLAAGQKKFLGNIYSPAQIKDFASYWNKVTPENAGKWGEVEAVRDRMDWSGLDAAYRFAKEHGFPFHMHVMVWGNQQPEWIEKLPPAEQREEIEEWFAAVAQRYPDADFVEVVNEPLHDPPNKDDEGGGNYIEALGGAGATGWDWILASFRLARQHFPHSKLLINDYSITNTPPDAKRYRAIIDLLVKEQLVDGIGVQAHAFATKPDVPMSVHKASLDLLAETGLPIYVTELDIDGATDAEQLRDYQRVFPVFWEHPAVRGITLWGFRPGMWRTKERAYLVRKDGSERPAMAWLRGYVRGVTGPASTAPGRPVHTSKPGIGRITAYDPSFHAIVPEGARIEKIADGFTWSEGPTWIRNGDYLLFTDVPENTLYRWSEHDGLSVFLRPSGYAGPELDMLREAGANGLHAEPDGTVLLADSGSRLVARFDPVSKRKTPLVTHFDGHRFNSPNDVVRRSDGVIFFTDPPYGLKGINESPVKELRFNGVFRLDPDGSVHLVDDGLSFPNGVELSPDGRTLYVSNADGERPIWMSYSLDDQGEVTSKRIFADATDLVAQNAPGLPDGMAMAADGTLFATGPGGVLVFSPDGRRLGRIETGSAIANCAFGDDGRTLYVTSHTFVARVRINPVGLGFGAQP
jgi:endo-1,4-beta-xylanase